MKLNTKEDIEAPIEEVFAALTDFDGFERAAMRRGADVERLDQNMAGGRRPGWRLAFTYRGKRRNMTARLIGIDEPDSLRFAASAKSLDGDLLVELVALSRRRTRVSVSLDVQPKTLAARIFIHSLTLAKAKVNSSFSARIRVFAGVIETRLRKPTFG